MNGSTKEIIDSLNSGSFLGGLYEIFVICESVLLLKNSGGFVIWIPN